MRKALAPAAASLITLCCGLHPLHAGVESIGGNGRITIPSNWIVTQSAPNFFARTTDFAVVVEAKAVPLRRPHLWSLETEARNTVFLAEWNAAVLETIQFYVDRSFGVLGLERQEPVIGMDSRDLYTCAGGYTVRWTDFTFIFTNTHWLTISVDADHLYVLSFSITESASAAQKLQVIQVTDSLSSTNTFDPVADSDNDGLVAHLEFLQGSSDSDPDSDDDGLSDPLEFALGSDPNQDQLPFLKNLISDYPDAFSGVFTEDQVQAGRFGDLFIEVNEGTASVTLSVQESEDLRTWTEATQVEANIPVSGRKKFFQFHVP